MQGKIFGAVAVHAVSSKHSLSGRRRIIKKADLRFGRQAFPRSACEAGGCADLCGVWCSRRWCRRPRRDHGVAGRSSATGGPRIRLLQTCRSRTKGTAGFSPRPDSPTIRIATKYPRSTLDYYNTRGIPVEIIALSGSIELAPLIGLADRIVDLVETGRTLKENGLEIVEVIAESSARLLVNRAGYQTKLEEVLSMIHALEKVVQCESSI